MAMRRRLRRRRGESPDSQPAWFEKIPSGAYWTAITVLVLLLVWFYDRSEKMDALQHIERAKRFEREQLFHEAVSEYTQALDNARLDKKSRGQVALHIGDVYGGRFQDFERAQSYYVRAKRLAPKLSDEPAVQKRIQAAQEKAGHARPMAAGTAATTAPLDSIGPPEAGSSAEDRRGPVVAKFTGGEVHAGEVDREMRKRPGYQAALARADRAEAEKAVEEALNRALVYRAAIEAGYDRDPDVAARLREYRKTLVSERYMQDARREAEIVRQEDIEDYYAKHQDRFVRPARIVVGLIKTTSTLTAQAALDDLRNGAPFGDVATSRSLDEPSRSARGLAGAVSEGEDFIPGVGHAPEAVKALMSMNANDITGVTEHGGAFYIFKVLEKTPRQEPSVDEVRAQIEAELRGRNTGQGSKGIYETLRKRYDAEVLREEAGKLWLYASQGTIPPSADGTSTVSLQAERSHAGGRGQ